MNSPQLMFENLSRLNIRAVALQRCGRMVLSSLAAVIRRYELAVGYRLGSAAGAHENCAAMRI